MMTPQRHVTQRSRWRAAGETPRCSRSRQPRLDLTHGAAPDRRRRCSPAHVARGTWRHGADRREDNISVRAERRPRADMAAVVLGERRRAG